MAWRVLYQGWPQPAPASDRMRLPEKAKPQLNGRGLLATMQNHKLFSGARGRASFSSPMGKKGFAHGRLCSVRSHSRRAVHYCSLWSGLRPPAESPLQRDVPADSSRPVASPPRLVRGFLLVVKCFMCCTSHRAS